MSVYTHRTKNKGSIVFLQELSVALQGEWQRILKVAILHTSSMPDRCRA